MPLKLRCCGPVSRGWAPPACGRLAANRRFLARLLPCRRCDRACELSLAVCDVRVIALHENSFLTAARTSRIRSITAGVISSAACPAIEVRPLCVSYVLITPFMSSIMASGVLRKPQGKRQCQARVRVLHETHV